MIDGCGQCQRKKRAVNCRSAFSETCTTGCGCGGQGELAVCKTLGSVFYASDSSVFRSRSSNEVSSPRARLQQSRSRSHLLTGSQFSTHHHHHHGLYILQGKVAKSHIFTPAGRKKKSAARLRIELWSISWLSLKKTRVEINQCVGRTRKFFTKSFLGDDAAVLARSNGEEPASPRYRRAA